MPTKSRDNDVHEVKLLVRDIHTALFGPDSNPEEGVFSIAKKTEKRVDRLETVAKTFWAIIVAIPILGTVLMTLGYIPPLNSHDKTQH